jgi:hypothetical protein
MCLAMQPHMHSHVSCTNYTTGSHPHYEDPTIGRGGAPSCIDIRQVSTRPVRLQDCTPAGQTYMQYPPPVHSKLSSSRPTTSSQVNPNELLGLHTYLDYTQAATGCRAAAECATMLPSLLLLPASAWVGSQWPKGQAETSRTIVQQKEMRQIQYKHRSNTTVVCSGIRANAHHQRVNMHRITTPIQSQTLSKSACQAMKECSCSKLQTEAAAGCHSSLGSANSESNSFIMCPATRG